MDRGCERRSHPGLLDGIWGSDSTYVMLIANGKTLVRGGRIALFPSRERAATELSVYLGRAVEGADVPVGTEIVLSVLPEGAEPEAYDGEWLSLRDVAAELSAQDAGLFVEALAISNWHLTHTHCPRCGQRTEIEQGGWVRSCPADGSQHFPRTDPAIIVSVIDEDDRLLLGRNSAWPASRYSTLAGFVEPGESLEAAVVREIEEESGVVVHSPTYLGSQPWPFPASLMIGFTAVATNAVSVPDGVEILDTRWFSRAELAAALKADEVQVASGISIARALIEHWYGGELPQAGQ
ncbi:NAD(+) diphosphatase [Arthrobacter sp. CAU 1506]|nr:NAD(+) diphosphatase [Arthrobacter sp. CAU 1506]